MFDKFILQDVPDERERLNTLANSADEVSEQEYHIKLSADDLTQRRAEFTKKSLLLRRIEQKKKEHLSEIKQEMKPIKADTDMLASELNTGYARKYGKLYKMIDHESRMVGYYSETGELIETLTRPATKDELGQLTIAHSMRTGTNN
jgi:hypothetical protein